MLGAKVKVDLFVFGQIAYLHSFACDVTSKTGPSKTSEVERAPSKFAMQAKAARATSRQPHLLTPNMICSLPTNIPSETYTIRQPYTHRTSSASGDRSQP